MSTDDPGSCLGVPFGYDVGHGNSGQLGGLNDVEARNQFLRWACRPAAAPP